MFNVTSYVIANSNTDVKITLNLICQIDSYSLIGRNRIYMLCPFITFHRSSHQVLLTATVENNFRLSFQTRAYSAFYTLNRLKLAWVNPMKINTNKPQSVTKSYIIDCVYNESFTEI